ncbi:MAG: hypothetical protein ACE37F_07005 [Nannocystaceae bacterium]|nr:hypothetical protein [bacterium]
MAHRTLPVALLLVCSCAHEERGEVQAPAQPLSAASMERHFEEADAMRAAAVRGEADTVREVATAFAARISESTYPQPWGPSVQRLETVLARASTVEGAAQSAGLVAEVGASCGGCHADNDVPVAVDWPSEPSPEHRMDTFAYATELLWLGLIVPSDAAWERGAQAYHAALSCEDFEAVSLGPHHVSLCSSVKATGASVVTANDAAGRQRAFADVVSTCAGCHGAAD